MRGALREVFGEEPRQGAYWWLPVLFGGVVLAYGLLAPLPPRSLLLVVPAGMMFLLLGVAELLPRGSKALAAALRIAGIAAGLFIVAGLVWRGVVGG
jgi:hypothetical protein